MSVKSVTCRDKQITKDPKRGMPENTPAITMTTIMTYGELNTSITQTRTTIKKPNNLPKSHVFSVVSAMVRVPPPLESGRNNGILWHFFFRLRGDKILESFGL